jgi:hypothetical protein
VEAHVPETPGFDTVEATQDALAAVTSVARPVRELIGVVTVKTVLGRRYRHSDGLREVLALATDTERAAETAAAIVADIHGLPGDVCAGAVTEVVRATAAAAWNQGQLPARIVIGADRIDALFTLTGDEDTGVGLRCRLCDDGGQPLAYYTAGAAYPDPDVVTVTSILQLLAAGADHLSRRHPHA